MPSLSFYFFIVLVIVLVLNGSGVNAFVEEEVPTTNQTITFQECFTAMGDADASDDESLSKGEYVVFIKDLEKDDANSNVTSFDQLSEPLQTNFYNYAANDDIMVIGVGETDANEEDLKILQDICNSTVGLLTVELPTKPKSPE